MPEKYALVSLYQLPLITRFVPYLASEACLVGDGNQTVYPYFA